MSSERARAMADRLARAAARVEISSADSNRIITAFEFGHQLRLDLLLEDHHPHVLHGARTALVLLEDAGVADADALGFATLYESRFPAFVVPAVSIRDLLGDRAGSFAATLPAPVADVASGSDRSSSDSDASEMLLAAEPIALLIALAERLDHARHLHLEPRTEWGDFHADFESVYVPLAERAHPRLARRCHWWTDMFARRYLRSGGPRETPA